jgi:hypothetical protein
MPEAEIIPLKLTPASAIKLIRELAADTNNIVIIPYGKKRTRERQITRRQVELCVQRGTIVEGPFMNGHGNWQMNLYRHAAGEEITCVLAIDRCDSKLLIINAF